VKTRDRGGKTRERGGSWAGLAEGQLHIVQCKQLCRASCSCSCTSFYLPLCFTRGTHHGHLVMKENMLVEWVNA
jgi:hypothetical protein